MSSSPLLDTLTSKLGEQAPDWLGTGVDHVLRLATAGQTKPIEIQHPAVSFVMGGRLVAAHNWKDYPENGCHEPIVTQAVVDVLGAAADPVFWDVGSVRGYFPMVATVATHGDAAVRVFEALPEHADQIERNGDLHARADWSIHKTRVGDGRSGTVRLDSHANESPTLIKIDVDGAEDAVLSGMDRLTDPGPAVLLELHRSGDYASRRQAAIDFFADRSYDLYVCERHRDAAATWDPIGSAHQLPGVHGPAPDYMVFAVPSGWALAPQSQ